MDNGNNLNVPFVLSVSKSQSRQKTKVIEAITFI